MADGKERSCHQTPKRQINGEREEEYVQKDPITAQHDLLITEIESADGHLGTTLRTIYDDSDPHQFLNRLDGRIKLHDREIERMCNYHYQGFIESIRGLLQVRGDVEKLKSEIQETNHVLQQSGLSLIQKVEALIKCRTTQNHIAQATDTLSVCLPVLEMYGKLREQMKAKRYYPALKTLEQLEHTYLPRVSKYRFSQVMCDNIPKVRESIKEASMSDLKDFLENIRKHSSKIGETAMKHAAEQNNMEPSLAVLKPLRKKRKAPLPPNPFTGKVEKRTAPIPPSPFGGEDPVDDDDSVEDEEGEEGLSAQDLIDFSPVFRCLHIYTVLGAKETFESYYRKQRRKQARLALQPPPNMSKKAEDAFSKHETLEGYKKYFHEIVGFFVVEDQILSTTTGLVNRAYIDELWEMSLSKIVAVLRTHSAFCTDPNLMLQIKDLIMLFCHTLRGYGFPVSQLYDLLLEIRDQYGEILMQKWVIMFHKIFQEDNYTPIMASDQQEYLGVTSVYPFVDKDLEELPFPKTFPFSQFVPKIYCEVKEYIYACLKFTDDLHLSQTEIDDMVRKLANVLLTRTLSGCLSALIKQPKLGLLELIQISINVNYLEKSSVYLEDFISNITGAERESIHVSRLQGTSMFKDARSEAEAQIYKKLNEKIDEFLDLAEYDWLMAEADGQPSDYITSVIIFLRTTFESFTNLPEKVAATACMSACKHLASAMMEFLKDTEVKSMSMGALQQFNLDLVQCEQFASSNPVPGMKEGILQLAFADLRQLLELFLAWDWTTYIAEFGQPKCKYLRVNPSTCIILLEKLKDADKKKSNLLATFKRNERDKKKLLDTVLKQLRTLQNGTTPHT